ncbi:MAG: archaeal cell division control protein 6 [Candidatus Methanomethylophilaceae archaeon]|nr:archaeal cell division control protein 6 [Candidatus Methanomethylophilaceae archaeon]MDI3542024.1 archaeal cell division control protein 6 [Candidatus Methanomethylophilaceae archaeon]HIJ00979.1 AAA family ATPase [Candidatus Methanomethylophilaceae archaeon]
MFERQPVIIRDPRVLAFDYVPQKLIHREEQLRSLSVLFRPLIEGGGASSAFLIGSVGTGKTATAKRFCTDILQSAFEKGFPMDYIYVNCRQNSTESSVLLRLIQHFDEGYPDRGFSVSEMLRTLKRHVEKRELKAIVILDEVDVLLKKGAEDLVYQLSRFNEEEMVSSASLSMIIISQEYVLDRLDQASISTLGRANIIRFSRYSRDELRDIVASRAEMALMPGSVREDSLDLIADIASEWGDARFAIELLEKSAMLAEEEGSQEVTAEMVREAKALTYSTITESRLEQLDLQHLLTLLAVTRCLKENAYVTTGKAERMYQLVAEEYGEKPRKHTQFWSYITDLSDQGLLETRVRGDPEGGRTTYISIANIPSRILRSKLEEMLNR